MSRRKRIKELETELRILRSEVYGIRRREGYSYHARYNKFVRRYEAIKKELERLSLKWKFKQIIRRIKNHG